MNQGNMTPTKALNLFTSFKQKEQDIPKEVWDVIKNYRHWNEFELTCLRNLSSYYSDIFIEDDMEENIDKLICIIQKREVEIPIY